MQSNRKLVIIGAGSLGLLTLDSVLVGRQYNKECIFFIDDSKNKDETIYGVKVIGGINSINKIKKDDYDFVIAIANNQIRKKIAISYDVNYVNIIHPSAVVSNFANLGIGNIIMANTTIDPNVKVGNHVILNKNISIGHDSILNNFSQVSPGSSFGGFTVLKEGAYIGLGANILPNVTVGKFSIIGAGAVVTKNIDNYCTAVGVPAKVIK